VGALLLRAATMHAQEYNLATIGVPGADSTWVSGISGTNIVGSFESDGMVYGFLFDGSNYTTIDVPGAAGTDANGISGTNIVGFYFNQGGNYEGFLFDGNRYTTIDVPGANVTEIFGIEGNKIVGVCHMTNTEIMEWQGFLFDGSSYTSIEVPGAAETDAYGICGTNIVGYFLNSYSDDDLHGFLYDGNGYTTIDVPGATRTAAYCVSGNNIGGVYYPGSANGFLFDGNSYTTNGLPGEVTGISGLNIVGTFTSPNTVGFVATPVTQMQGSATTNGTFQMTVVIPPPHYPAIIQASIDLVNWVNIYTNTPPFVFTDSITTTSVRFFRAELSP